MAKRLFSCSASDTEEIEYFSHLMEENNIEHYDTPGSSFGLSKPSLWIKKDDDFLRAQEIFKAHEEKYAELAREKYQRETGYNPHATSDEKKRFFLNNLYQKRGLLPILFLGFVIVYWYFSSLMGLFTGT